MIFFFFLLKTSVTLSGMMTMLGYLPTNVNFKCIVRAKENLIIFSFMLLVIITYTKILLGVPLESSVMQ